MRKPSVVALIAFAVGACNFGSKGEQTDRALPEPEPASKTPPARPAEANPTPQRPRESDKPAAPATATPEATATAKPDPGTAKPDPGTAKPEPAKSAPTSSAPAPTPTTAPTLTLPPVDGGLSVPSAACIQKCQGRLQACISKPIALDGGLPSLDSMNECKKAFEDCRGDCS